MTRADQFEPLPAEAADRWAKFGKSETVFSPMLLGHQARSTRGVLRERSDRFLIRATDRQERADLQHLAGSVSGVTIGV